MWSMVMSHDVTRLSWNNWINHQQEFTFRSGTHLPKTWIALRSHLCEAPCSERMRILALDHGTVRIGVATSDELRMIASPLEYIPAEPFADFVTRLKQLLREKEVEQIVVGMPRNMDGSYGPAAEKVRDFIGKLALEVTIPIRTWDERLTSSQANRILIQGNVRRDKRKQTVDKMAAAILLQSYLDASTS